MEQGTMRASVSEYQLSDEENDGTQAFQCVIGWTFYCVHACRASEGV